MYVEIMGAAPLINVPLPLDFGAHVTAAQPDRLLPPSQHRSALTGRPEDQLPGQMDLVETLGSLEPQPA